MQQPEPEPPAGKLPPKLSPAELFAGFFKAGILGFGGVLPVARRIIVDERRWMSQAEFNDLFSLCQFMPGANIVNLSFAFGARNAGFAGAAAAAAGLFAAPIVIVLGLAFLYARYGGIPVVEHGLRGLAASGAGLALGAGLRISQPVLVHLRAILVAVPVFLLVVFAHLTLPLVIAISLPVSLLLALKA